MHPTWGLPIHAIDGHFTLFAHNMPIRVHQQNNYIKINNNVSNTLRCIICCSSQIFLYFSCPAVDKNMNAHFMPLPRMAYTQGVTMKYYQLDFHSNTVIDDVLHVYADSYSIRRESIGGIILYVSQYKNTPFADYPCSLWCWESGKIQGNPILGLTLKDVINLDQNYENISSLSDVAKLVSYPMMEHACKRGGV